MDEALERALRKLKSRLNKDPALYERIRAEHGTISNWVVHALETAAAETPG